MTKEEADKRVEGYKITADTFVSEPYSLNTLNNVSSQADFANISRLIIQHTNRLTRILRNSSHSIIRIILSTKPTNWLKTTT